MCGGYDQRESTTETGLGHTLKSIDAPTGQRRVQPLTEDTSVFSVIDDGEDGDGEDFSATGEGPKEVIVDPKGQMDLGGGEHALRDFGLEEDGDSDEMRCSIQSLYDALYSICAAGKAANDNVVLGLTRLREKKVVNAKRMDDILQCLIEVLSVYEASLT